jgi:hypothetical protein
MSQYFVELTRDATLGPANRLSYKFTGFTLLDEYNDGETVANQSLIWRFLSIRFDDLFDAMAVAGQAEAVVGVGAFAYSAVNRLSRRAAGHGVVAAGNPADELLAGSVDGLAGAPMTDPVWTSVNGSRWTPDVDDPFGSNCINCMILGDRILAGEITGPVSALPNRTGMRGMGNTIDVLDTFGEPPFEFFSNLEDGVDWLAGRGATRGAVTGNAHTANIGLADDGISWMIHDFHKARSFLPAEFSAGQQGWFVIDTSQARIAVPR